MYVDEDGELDGDVDADADADADVDGDVDLRGVGREGESSRRRSRRNGIRD